MSSNHEGATYRVVEDKFKKNRFFGALMVKSG
jgi:hypothetical protein